MMLVLIVDDTADVRALLRYALERAGTEVLEAAGASDALRMLGAGIRPDLVLLDVQMPVMDGWDALTKIRSDPAMADLRVAMCTVKGRGADHVRGWELGCDAYITKPFDVFGVADVVRRIAEMTEDERRDARARGLAAAKTMV